MRHTIREQPTVATVLPQFENLDCVDQLLRNGNVGCLVNLLKCDCALETHLGYRIRKRGTKQYGHDRQTGRHTVP